MIRKLLALGVLTGLVVFAGARSVHNAHRVQAAASIPFTTVGETPWTVPAGVTKVLVQADGAAGGTSNCGSLGGAGGETKAILTVVPGTQFFVEVGGQGAGNNTGGQNGGGLGGPNGGLAPASSAGASGGGAADFRSIALASPGSVGSRIVVGGGGGGAGGCGNGVAGAGVGGAGGSGPNGNGSNGGDNTGGGGQAGSAGGAGGTGTVSGTTGNIFFGGSGGGPSVFQTFTNGAGGGGGGGFTGGGGGGSGTAIVTGGGGGGGGSGSSGLLAGTGRILINIGTNPARPAQVIITPLDPPALLKSFAPNPIFVNDITVMTWVISNPNSVIALSNVATTDSLPAGIRVAATPNVINTCAGTVTAAAGAATVTLSGGTIAASGSCTITLNVQGVQAGSWPNSTTAITSSEAPDGASNTATLVVNVVPVNTATPTFTPTFTPTSTTVPSVPATPTFTPTPTVTPIFVPSYVATPVIPVFQNPAAGALFNPIAKSPTPRPIVAAVVDVPPGQGTAGISLRPPNTGDAGLKALEAALQSE